MKEEMIFKPTLEQLKIDKKREVFKYLAICVLAAMSFILLEAAALTLFLPIGLIVIYYRYISFKKGIVFRYVRVKKDMILQDAPGMHIKLKRIKYDDYCGAQLRGEQVYLKMEGQKLSMNMKISLGTINLEGYPDKEKIANEINERIKQYKM
jgi:hypothetical protein